MNSWHIITSEYPPQMGGVSDYTQMIARGLADAGDEVHVWCPAVDRTANGAKERVDGKVDAVSIHRELGSLTPSDLHRVSSMLDQFPAPRRILVQWVPHGYGYRSMNLPFCLWIWNRAVRRHDTVQLMVHEPYLTFGDGSWKQSGVAAVHRLMTMVLLAAARSVWISVPAWEKLLRPYALGRSLSCSWLPVASNIPVVDEPPKVKSIRAHYLPAGGQLVGHFGTYDRKIVELLGQSVPELLRISHCNLLLLGHGSETMRAELIRKYPEFAGRVYAAGTLAADDLSLHVSACDLMLQPYPDGVSSRRTSTMVGLAHGLAIVTTSGHLTEPLWAQSGAIALTPIGELPAMVCAAQQLLEDGDLRSGMSEAARSLYRDYFDLEKTIVRLREHAL
jgi:glycosyltransferase involved in cell wall biosynthesis